MGMVSPALYSAAGHGWACVLVCWGRRHGLACVLMCRGRGRCRYRRRRTDRHCHYRNLSTVEDPQESRNNYETVQ